MATTTALATSIRLIQFITDSSVQASKLKKIAFPQGEPTWPSVLTDNLARSTGEVNHTDRETRREISGILRSPLISFPEGRRFRLPVPKAGSQEPR